MSTEQGTRAPLVPIFAALIALALVVADRLAVVSFPAWALLVVAGAGAALSAVITLLQENGAAGWARVVVHRIVTLTGVGAWATWADLTGWTGPVVLSGLGGTLALALLGTVCQVPAAVGAWAAAQAPPAAPEPDWRDTTTQRWERIVRQVTKLPVEVTRWEPWADPADGVRLFVELPAALGTTTADLAAKAANIAAAARLPRGCAISVLDGDRQGVAVLDVMLRDNLAYLGELHDEPTSPASINDDVPVLTTPRGDRLSFNLRIKTTVVGGAPGSGKTTLIFRLLMFLARCTDTLIWVVDLNGGGVAADWVEPWAQGKASKPVVDWLAPNPPEAAALLTAAAEIGRDRKTDPEARAMRKAANSAVLPVSPRKPLIMVIVDEGGDARMTPGIFADIAVRGITRLAHIGRAEGVRTLISVIRGTSDLLDKALRIASGNRLSMGQEEHGEHNHVLGVEPGVQLPSAVGSAFLRTSEIRRPVLGRTVNVDPDSIERHAIATAHLRPDLDARGQLVASRVTARMVLEGRDPTKEQMSLQVLRDCDAGLVYANRWERYGEQLAGMRGEEWTGPAAQPAAGGAPATSTSSSALDSWLVDDPAPAPAVPAPAAAGGNVLPFRRRGGEQQTAPAPAAPVADTARERILALVRAAGADGVAASELERRAGCRRSHVYDLLGKLQAAEQVGKNAAGLYVLAQYAQQIG